MIMARWIAAVFCLVNWTTFAADDLLLNHERFQVHAEFMDSNGQSLTSGSMRLDEATGFDETGYFWVNDPDQLDLVVRVLDGCALNDRFWVFAASLTNVEYELTVVDTLTSDEATYVSGPSKLAPPIQDTVAFATCPSSKTKHTSMQSQADQRVDSLSLIDDRFLLEIDWTIPGQGSGKGQVGVATPVAGAFWFLDRSDLNVYVQITDARSINGHYWLAYTSLTGANYSLKVTDTLSGIVKTYLNHEGQAGYGIDSFLDEAVDQALLFPWISNSEQYESTLIINNINCLPADVSMQAKRENGDIQTITRTVPALGFLETKAADLFPDLGVGPGYAVEVNTPTSGIRGRWVTNNITTNSPSQGVAIQVPDTLLNPLPANADIGNSLLFGYLPLNNDFVSAPVIVNVGDAPTDVTLYFYDQQGRVIASDFESARQLQPFRPFARLTLDLVGGRLGNVSMVAHSPDQPLSGVVFVFNDDGEPAIGNASAIDFVPPN